MIQRILNSKNFVACLLASGDRDAPLYKDAFPRGQPVLRVDVSLGAARAFLGFKYSYIVFLYTTPYIGYSILLSGLYIFALKIPQRIRPGRLPAYPDPRKRTALSLVIGEVHNPRKPVPAAAPHWLIVPERGLFTGIAIFGAVGTGKTSCCMYPFAEQILAYCAGDKEKRIGGLVLEVKGDFCHKIKEILARHGREDDYIEISLDSQYRYNPLHNDLDAYALAYSIASLLNNLFGKGKEPFWQQAYTNLVKFIILLHKIAYDYVTLFDVYESAISPDILEKKIQDAERRLEERYFLLVSAPDYRAHFDDLKLFEFALDEPDRDVPRQRHSRSAAVSAEQIHRLRIPERSRFRQGRSRPAGTTASRQALVLQRLAAHRAEAADFHRRRHLRFPVAFRRQPGCEKNLLPAAGMLRPEGQRRLPLWQASAVIQLAHRKRQGLLP